MRAAGGSLAAGVAAAGSAAAGGAAPPPPPPPPPARYEAAPPPWRPLFRHADAQLGHAGVRPPARGARTTASASVRHGFTTPAPVANESASMHGQIHAQLSRGRVLPRLNALFDAVRAERRTRPGGDVAAPSYKAPARAMFHDDKLVSYIRALADADVPLHTLSHSVPHGCHGERLLDMLCHGAAVPAASSTPSPAPPAPRPVPLHRALWFLHVVGMLESNTLRARTAGHHTDAWTAHVLAWLAKQLHAVAPGLDAAALGSDAWMHKWSYSVALLQAMLEKDLVVRYTVFAWLVDHLDAPATAEDAVGAPRAAKRQRCARPAAPFLLPLIDAHLDAILAHGALASRLVRALCAMDTAAGAEARRRGGAGNAAALWPPVQDTPASLLARVRAMCPEAFVNMALPRMPGGAGAGAVGGVGDEAEEGPDGADGGEADAAWAEARTALLRAALAPLLLGGEGGNEMGENGEREERSGEHRIPVAVALVRLFDACQKGRLVLGDGTYQTCAWAPVGVFDAVAQWVDVVDAAHSARRGSGVLPARGLAEMCAAVGPVDAARLLGALGHRHLFSFSRFLQRLVARGLVRLNAEAPKTLRHSAGVHARILRSMPVHDATEALLRQRRHAVYGARLSESHEEASERRAMRELRRAFPWLGRPAPTPFGLHAQLPHVWTSSPFTQDRLATALVRALLHADATPTAAQFAHVATLLTALGAMDALARVVGALLDRRVEPSCVVSLCQTVRAHVRTWDALDVVGAFAAQIAPHAVQDGALSLRGSGRSMAVPMARKTLDELAGE
ncbi:RNA polymerase II mediator complex subunit [Malassezia sp. CBS 17886]|nr:RNA polymerase II mediator complex subunit [Malassezia sp. CBS 17886]